MEDLLVRSDLRHLMLIGAYRDNEVDATHLLMRKLAAITDAGGKITAFMLGPLTVEHLEECIEDTFPSEPERTAALAQLIHDKTAGNPFFMMPDGSLKYVRTVGRPSTGEDPKSFVYVGTVIDITERNRAEEERERLRQLEADLAHMNRLTTLGELTASRAHDLLRPAGAQRPGLLS